MILGLATALVLLSLFYLMRDAKRGILVTIASKPIIDATWSYNVAGFNLLKVIGVAVPVILLAYVLRNRDNLMNMPLAFFWWLYLFDLLLISFIFGFDYSTPLVGFEYFLRGFNGFIAFFFFQKYFAERAEFRALVVAFLVAGIFPIAMGAYQAFTGEIWQYRQTVGLARKVGLYHDAFSFRSYAFQTLAACLLYYNYYLTGKKIQVFSLVLLTSGSLLLIFNIYSKAGYLILLMWLITWCILARKWAVPVLLVCAIIAANIWTGGKVLNEVQQVFTKEATYLESGDSRSQERVLAGRPTLWKPIFADWTRLDSLDKLWGYGRGAAFHNDYLRVLFNGGILGLIIYVALLAAIGWRLVMKLISGLTPLRIVGFMIYLMWLVDTIGLVPGQYPAYQWFVWGFIALSLKGVRGLDDPKGRTQTNHSVRNPAAQSVPT